MPELARRAERLSQELDDDGGARHAARPATVEGIGQEVARHDRSGRVALWVIALVAVRPRSPCLSFRCYASAMSLVRPAAF